MTKINQMEAGAFYTHSKLLGLTTAQALDELGRTTWPDTREDLMFGRKRHTPTIRRLAKALCLRLDEEAAADRAATERRSNRAAAFEALPEEVKQAISDAVLNAGGKDKNAKARALAASHGIQTISIEQLAELTHGGYNAVISLRMGW